MTMPMPIKALLNGKSWVINFSLITREVSCLPVWEWCWDNFGHPGTDPETGVKSVWDYYSGWLFLYDEKAIVMYILKWG